MRKLVIMGGSFNPPTKAHLKLIQTAMDSVGADKGYFVPVSFAYLKRKMRKQGNGNLCIPDALRWKMLEAMCELDKRLAVSDLELYKVQAETYNTLSTFAGRNPDTKCYFIVGADKLELMARLGRKTDFLDRFGLIVFSREQTDTEKLTGEMEGLKEYGDAIVLLRQPEGIGMISSTEVRRRMLAGEAFSEYVCPSVERILKGLTAEDFPEEIERFQGEYEYLNNSYPVDITWEGLTYLSAESAFQASKSKEEKIRRTFAGLSADRAKRRGAALTPYKGWEWEKEAIMEEILRKKFEQHPELAKKLAGTENRLLIAGHNGKDRFWGVDLYSLQGENRLGKLLMKIREDYGRLGTL